MATQHFKDTIQQDQLSEIDIKRKKLLSKRAKITIGILILIVTIINVMILSDLPPGATYLDKRLGSKSYVIGIVSVLVYIFIPAGSFILSLILSLLPFGGRKYTEKLVAVNLILLLTLEICCAISAYIDHTWRW